MNITLKGIIKTVVIGGIAYNAGKLATLGKLVLVCKDRPDDIKEAIAIVCDMWSTLEEQQTEIDDTTEEEETAPVIQVTSAVEEETPEENQPED